MTTLLQLFTLIIYFSNISCFIIDSWNIAFTCGDRHVAKADLRLYEYKDGGFHKEISSFHGVTDIRGQYKLNGDILKSLRFDTPSAEYRIMIKDMCGLDKIECNLPHNRFEISLNSLFSKRQHTVDLSHSDWEPFRGTHCS
ncbi:TransThyretin-Related family domain [Caenorhabditis elegans]|uniref:TransThyretin-Related family domain n=1 Tax=Caenorhabditis elegans TaxID=6239 RepID=O17357_CAEEL|nr:TransThyretin-Related family domain [Caenorhabditis elegans]CCD63243.1 TransThyretin-Related family domain [Caenorhabditis elegans]|eukprot:NP_503311.2 Uncharacterized protein CELE_C05E4.7 [Caenorhabditis elegans]